MSGYQESWRDRPAAQQPDWPDRTALEAATADLRGRPALVTAAECDLLRDRLAEVAAGRAFVLQGGDCAETFTASAAEIRAKRLLLRHMAMIVGYASAVPVVQIGRLAGQFGKPRSAPAETRGGRTLPVYRGEAVNAPEFTERARRPDPDRLRRAYRSSARTARVLHGEAEPPRRIQARAWRGVMARHALLGCRHDAVTGPIENALDGTAGRAAEFHLSHEALLLEYESALVRPHPRGWYGGSGHLLWIGERTREVTGAHVQFAAGIANPIAVKLGPTATPADVRALVDRLDPGREPGRLTFVARMGAERVRDALPALVEAARDCAAPVVWLSDPMHGNTVQTADGRKTRRFADILDEVAGFFEVHERLGSHPGGLHLELTGEDVTECLGGVPDLRAEHLPHRYESLCDPRLNRQQALELAFLVADRHREALAV